MPRALLLVLALLQAVGITDYVRRMACEVECKADGCDDDGPCDSSTCTCHSPTARPMTAPVVADVEAAAPIDVARAEFAPQAALRGSPDPREILHVPRLVRV